MFNLGLKLMWSRLVVSQQVLTKAWLLKQGSVHISTVANSVLIRRWKASDCTCCHDTSRTSLLGSMRQNKSLARCAATALCTHTEVQEEMHNGWVTDSSDSQVFSPAAYEESLFKLQTDLQSLAELTILFTFIIWVNSSWLIKEKEPVLTLSITEKKKSS